MNKISLMQGRLSPPFEDRFQAYPANNWQEEFYAGAKLGLYSIEWIYEKPYATENALSADVGINTLKDLILHTGVTVKSICADYYMTERLVSNGEPVLENWQHLEWLCGQAQKLDITYIILPFVDQSSVNEQDIEALIKSLQLFLALDKNLSIELHLETDLPPQRFQDIFQEVNHPMLKLNYDIGNSASLGYDPDVELDILGQYLGSVHIKDRLLNGKTVCLGTGNANFAKCFKWFTALKFNRWYVLQAARDKAGEEIQNIASQMEFVLNNVASHGS